MPFLRFTRDKRGYETTSLVHAVRRQGRSRQRILYWFRTPPDVKVGRPALDEEAIRWIEEHNPDIEFDWPTILEAKPSPGPPPEDARNRRVRRDKTDRPSPAQPRPAAPVPVAGPEPSLRVEPETPEIDAIEGDEEPVAAEPEVAEALEQLAHADVDPEAVPSGTLLERAIGREQLIRLRARYAELQARIAERGGDAERIEALKTQAESLNPDIWVTDEEARKGLEEFEPKIRDLRAALGLRRRRRSRRGGRRHRTNTPVDSAQSPAPAPEPEPE